MSHHKRPYHPKDYEDYPHGVAFFFTNKIQIWVPSLGSPIRGVYDWLRNVTTHEFTHIVLLKLP
ncbi:MAG: hypothetical protein OXF08_04900 [Bacteroidetes bacterium]|nr:hypothetical protein [Bacteroidota bacterium]